MWDSQGEGFFLVLRGECGGFFGFFPSFSGCIAREMRGTKLCEEVFVFLWGRRKGRKLGELLGPFFRLPLASQRGDDEKSAVSLPVSPQLCSPSRVARTMNWWDKFVVMIVHITLSHRWTRRRW